MAAPLVYVVAGLCGGAGTSTVALAVGGLLAWSGRRALVVGDDDLLRLCGRLPWSGPGLSELAALDPADAAAEAGVLARAVPGVEGLAVIGGGMPPRDFEGWPADAVVVDRRSANVPAAAALLVARPDGSLAAGRDERAPVVVRGRLPLRRSDARRLLGRAPAAWLPEDARVARAGLAGRVPAGLPGSWLAALRGALTA